MLTQIAVQPPLVLAEPDFVFFQNLIASLSGISLSNNKIDLVAARLRSHVAKLGLNSFEEYRKLLASAKNGDPILQSFINLLTTNKTDFFREAQHFEYLVSEHIPQLLQNNRGLKTIRAWCAASSTGEEAYTLAMVLRGHLPQGCRFEIIASDIDSDVLAIAKNGVYPQSRLHEIPEGYRDQNVQLGQQQAAGWFKIRDSIHQNIQFLHHNLVDTTTGFDRPFDIIFCRNVFIYFTPAVIQRVVAKLHGLTKPGGLLLIGHAESIGASKGLFQTVKPAIYRRPPNSA